MVDRITTVPCLTTACGGAVTLRLGYTPAYAGRGRIALANTTNVLRQTCSCPMSDEDIFLVRTRARHHRAYPIPAGS
jgi:hypothetical protein